MLHTQVICTFSTSYSTDYPSSPLPSGLVDEIEDDVLLSGWGEVDDMREDLLKDWGDLLDKWDGKEKTRPKQLVKLCRKVGWGYSLTG